MYDQLGGGFARYSVDADWVVPHFEKMLYDNALLLGVYLHWWRATGRAAGRARRARDRRLPAARPAHARGRLRLRARRRQRGASRARFYVWPPRAAVRRARGRRTAAGPRTCRRHRRRDVRARRVGPAAAQDPDDRAAWERSGRGCSRRGQCGRARRGTTRSWPPGTAWPSPRSPRPARCWASRVGGGGDWRRRTCWSAVHLGGAEATVAGDRLVRVSRDGVAGHAPGVLEDYADVAEGLARAVPGDRLTTSGSRSPGILFDVVLRHFGDGRGGFFDTADDAEALVRRPQEPADNATPVRLVGGARRLADLRGPHRLGAAPVGRRAGRSAVVPALAGRGPRSAGWGLAVGRGLAGRASRGRRRGSVGRPADRGRCAAARWSATAPGAVVAVGDPADSPAVPLLRDRPLVDGAAGGVRLPRLRLPGARRRPPPP